MKCSSLFCPKTIGRRSVTSGQWWIQGKDLARPALILRPNWGPKDWQKFFWRLAPPAPLSQGLDDCPLPLYLKVWIYHCRLSWWQNFWNSTIFLDRDSHLHCQTMEKIHGLPFGSWVQSCSYLSFFFFFLPFQGLLISNAVMWYNDVSTIVDLNYP